MIARAFDREIYKHLREFYHERYLFTGEKFKPLTSRVINYFDASALAASLAAMRSDQTSRG